MNPRKLLSLQKIIIGLENRHWIPFFDFLIITYSYLQSINSDSHKNLIRQLIRHKLILISNFLLNNPSNLEKRNLLVAFMFRYVFSWINFFPAKKYSALKQKKFLRFTSYDSLKIAIPAVSFVDSCLKSLNASLFHLTWSSWYFSASQLRYLGGAELDRHVSAPDEMFVFLKLISNICFLQIIGGTIVTSSHKWPWQVYVEVHQEDGKAFRCGGLF